MTKKNKLSKHKPKSKYGHLILIVGKGSSGKSHSLINLKNTKNSQYINSDNKPLPIKNKFGFSSYIDKPKKLLEHCKNLNKLPLKKVPTNVILDTITHLMGLYDLKYIQTAKDTRAAWGGYKNFYIDLINTIKLGPYNTIVMAHLDTEYDEDGRVLCTSIPVAGYVKKVGVETAFSTIFEVVKVPVSKLKKYKNPLLHITDQEKRDGIKRCFLTRPYKGNMHSLARSQFGMFTDKQLFIDNDVQQVLDLMDKY